MVAVVLGRVASWIATTALGWPPVVSADVVTTAVATAVITGVVFGYYPAHRASSLDPSDAIRSED